MADHHQGIMCEVEIQQDGQECCVEIESVPIEIPDDEGMEPMLGGHLDGRDIILEPQEEIIDESGDPLDLYDVPVPDASDIYAEQAAPGPSIKRKRGHQGSSGFKQRPVHGGIVIKNEPMLYEAPLVDTKPRKWEQKQVQIKTMEGEFSVTMWASGTSDGKYLEALPLFCIRRQRDCYQRVLEGHGGHSCATEGARRDFGGFRGASLLMCGA